MDTKTPTQIAAERAVDVMGGPVNTARLLNVKDHRHQTVQSWLRNRVPSDYCPAIERETGRIAIESGDPSKRVTCEQLRPDVDWGVLRKQGATPRSKREAPVAADRPAAEPALWPLPAERRADERREHPRNHSERRSR